MDQRQTELLSWLSLTLKYKVDSLQPASADASFRRYFRAVTDHGTFVVMDAPPDKENCRPFVDSAKALSSLKVHSPEIIDSDLTRGFLILEDLGNRTYLDELRQNSSILYTKAIDSLIKIQSGIDVKSGYQPPFYSAAKLTEEMSLFSRWFINKHLGRSIHEPSFAVWLHTQQMLVKACMQQPQVWVHRDYHSRNLMITESNSPGLSIFKTW